jgi:hypothetical protein
MRGVSKKVTETNETHMLCLVHFFLSFMVFETNSRKGNARIVTLFIHFLTYLSCSYCLFNGSLFNNIVSNLDYIASLCPMNVSDPLLVKIFRIT